MIIKLISLKENFTHIIIMMSHLETILFWQEKGVPFDYPGDLESLSESQLMSVMMDLNRSVYKFLCTQVSQSKGVPPGNWYMVTLTPTQGDSAKKEDMIAMHERFLENISSRATVVHASLEKSAIWHVHYAINWHDVYAKNLKRDVMKASGARVVDVGRKVQSLKRWQGLCKYLLKDEYEDTTHVEYLIDGIKKIKGKGYSIDSPPPPS